MTRTSSAWSTQQLTEFVTAVSDAGDETAALREGLQRAAEALDAEVAAVVRGGVVAASLGWPREAVPAADLLAAAAAGSGAVDVPGTGPVPAVVMDLVDDRSAQLVLARAADPHFDAVEIGLLRGMARTLTLSLRTLRSVEVLRERQRLLEGLGQIQRAIARRVPLSEVLELVVDLTAELLGDELPALFLRDPEEPGTLVLQACRGLDDGLRDACRRRRVGEGVAGRAVSEDRLVVVEDYSAAAAGMQIFRDSRLQAAMAVPVHEGGQAVGSLLVSSWTVGRHYDAGAQELLQTIAQHVSLALTDAKTVTAMVHQALHDALTGLPNRALFLDRLEHALARAKRGGSDVAVLFLDLDRFKTVNDSLGHAAGDELLCVVAERIADCMRAADTAARLGGDEFAILLEDLVSNHEAVRVAERLIASLAEPIAVAGRDVVRGRLGRDRHGHARRRTTCCARPTWRCTGPRPRARAATRSSRPGCRRRSSSASSSRPTCSARSTASELEVFYQPIIALSTGELAGHEALVRWRHPTRGLLSPIAFIPVAEETGLIVADRALRAARGLPPGRGLAGRRGGSAVDQRQPLRPPARGSRPARRRHRASCARPACRRPRLVLEITETVLMHDTETTIDRLRALRALGVRLAVDDFGTGYSSLRYLNRFPVDVLKMAKPFVDGLGSNEEDPALARAIVDLGASLGLQIIAEGIESAAQLTQLRRLGCPLGQGYWFARPMPVEEASGHLGLTRRPLVAG